MTERQDDGKQYQTVAKVGDIAEGQGQAFEVGDKVIAVFLHDGRYYAIDDMCPHMGASLATGFLNTETMWVACPWHGWRFDVRDGTWCDNRRIKTDAFDVRLVGEEIQVSLEPVPKGESSAGQAE